MHVNFLQDLRLGFCAMDVYATPSLGWMFISLTSYLQTMEMHTS